MQTLQKYLSQHSYRLTKPRQVVFAYLQANCPTTTKQVCEALARDIDRASIYRTLKLLRQLQMIEDVVISGTKMLTLSDRVRRHHHHLHCTSCGLSRSFHSQAGEELVQAVAETAGFSADNHQFEISGICQKCRQTASHPTS